MQNSKKTQRLKRQRRIKAKIRGISRCPRLVVYRSNKYIYGQIIDDQKHQTLVSFSDNKLKVRKTKTQKAELVGEKIAELAKKKKIKRIVFDRGGYQYHGRVRALAQGARKGGLKF
jgi:large subunit ribosomal protein L18